MENREPYEIRKLMIVYNAFQTVFSFWMFKESWAFFVTGDYSWHCQPVDYSNNDQVTFIIPKMLPFENSTTFTAFPSGSPSVKSWLVVFFLQIC